MSQAPYPYQPNGSMARFTDDPAASGYAVPPHASQSMPARNIRPTIVAAQPYPGQANYIIHTDDATTKLSDRVRRKCYNCRTTDTSTWRRSSLTPGKVVSINHYMICSFTRGSRCIFCVALQQVRPL